MFFYYMQEFSNEHVQNMLDNGNAIDGTAGGLILGRSHDEGGIYFLQNFGSCYKLLGEVEGYEYILNIAASYMTRNSFGEINNHERDKQMPFDEYTPDINVRVIDTRLPINSKYETKFILFEGRGAQCIINRHSTKRLIEFIDEVNQQYSYEFDNTDFFLTRKVKIVDNPTGKVIDTCSIIWKQNE